MGAFELDCGNEVDVTNNRRIREECIIALKAYDFCRQQDCLTSDVLGPARAAETKTIGTEHITEGSVIDPPSKAASVSIENLKVKKVVVVSKEPSPFKNGFWDIELEYVFSYKLIFKESDGSIIDCIRATSVFNKKITLFGSIGNNITLSTDLFACRGNDSFTLDSEPFILVESKAVALSAELKYQRRRCGCEDLSPEANEVLVTIGLFTIIKLFRIVNLSVESKGFCIPEQCEETSAALNPCEFFENLDFPMDIFAPPQKPEFMAGISNNIPNNNGTVAGVTDSNCGCGNCNSCSCCNVCNSCNKCC